MAVLENTIKSADVAPAISIDQVSNLVENFKSLQEVLGIADMVPMASGNTIRVYNTAMGTLNKQADEGDIIPLTEVKLTEGDPIVIDFDLYRKLTTAQAIQKTGRDRAISVTDNKLVGAIRKDVKDSFYTELLKGSGTADAGANMQEALANAWGEMQEFYDDMDVNPVYFVNPKDVAKYLGSAQISTQNAFGFSYVEDFLGLGTAIFAPKVTQGTVVATAKENLRGAYVPANGEVGQELELVSDESGIVGITHGRVLDRGSIETVIMCGVLFYAENLAGVFKGSITSTGA